MPNGKENVDTQLISFDLCQKTLFKKNNFYLPKITFILQDAPCKMLTFYQLLDKMAALINKDKKSIKNGLRICLSSNKCFVEISVVPGVKYSKRNCWKLDYSQITGSIVCRYFIGMLHLFPELASKVRKVKPDRQSEHQPAACSPVQVRNEVKFSSPFSIESLLKTDSPSAQDCTASPPSTVMLRAEQQQQLWFAGTKRSFSWDSEEHLLLQPPSGSFSICSAGGSTHHYQATADGATESIRRMSECTDASFSVYTRARAAPYFSSQHSSYITYSVPVFTHDAVQF